MMPTQKSSPDSRWILVRGSRGPDDAPGGSMMLKLFRSTAKRKNNLIAMGNSGSCLDSHGRHDVFRCSHTSRPISARDLVNSRFASYARTDS